MFLQNVHIYLHIYAQSAMGKLNEMCNLMSRGNTHVFICENRQKVILLQYIVLFKVEILYKLILFTHQNYRWAQRRKKALIR